MKILVCVKLFSDGVNPFDECALELALSQKNAEITLVSMAPENYLHDMKTLTRHDIKSAYLLCDRAFAGSDTLATSYILSEFIKTQNPDLIICGRQSIDGDTAQVGPEIAQRLGIELHTNLLSLDGKNCITRFGKEKIKYPALITVERINTLRFPSIFSEEKPVRILSADDLKIDKSKCGLTGSPTQVVNCFENTLGMRHCKFIKKDQLEPLIEKLKGQHRRAKKQSASGEKLPLVHIVGKELLPVAKSIAEKVIVIEETDCDKIADALSGAKVGLFSADLTGRKIAPQVAAKLSAGLCADCTKLEVENQTLYMYRPARGGNITAKIKCKGRLALATVRCESDSLDIVVGMGRGIEKKTAAARAFAKKIGGQVGASRGLVDTGGAMYEEQIGLTGKMISPKIYIAVGISGAVHHTCAVSGADTIIAINPDRKARIFDYADYGILEEF